MSVAIGQLVPTTSDGGFDFMLRSWMDKKPEDINFEHGFCTRLTDGGAYPNGTLFWSMYLSDITPEAWALARELFTEFHGIEVPEWTRDSELFERLLHVVPSSGWWGRMSLERRREIQEIRAGCRFVNCGGSESRNYRTFAWACSQLIGWDEAKRLAAPELLRPLLPQYIDLVVAANNAVDSRWNGLSRGNTTPLEIELIRAHQFSDEGLLEIAQSPIAALFLAQHADPAELAAVQQRNLRQAA